jgi:hypothetical protein
MNSKKLFFNLAIFILFIFIGAALYVVNYPDGDVPTSYRSATNGAAMGAVVALAVKLLILKRNKSEK